MSSTFTFTATVWVWQGPSSWYFVSLPADIADEIEDLVEEHTRGFGSVRVMASSKTTMWRTSIFPDKKRGTFILPMKKQVREELGCEEGSRVRISLSVLID